MTDFKFDSKRDFRRKVLSKLATYFQVPKQEKEELFTDEVLNSDVMYSDYLADNRDFKFEVYVAHIKKFKLPQVMKGRNFLKSNAYLEYVNARGAVEDPESFIMAIHMGGDEIWFMYEDNGDYEGDGAVVVNSEDGQFIFEPFLNFLESRHPKNTYTDVD